MKIPIAATLTLFAVFTAYAQQTPYAQLRDTGPRSLIIAYRTNPGERAELRRYMVEKGVARFAAWKRSGVLKGYRILFNSYLDTETCDMLAVLEFADNAGIVRWREIEKQAPGGLTNDALRWIASAVTTPADVFRRSSSTTGAELGQSVFFIIPYDYLVATGEYTRYLEGYVVPQVDGWIGENVLAGYTMFLGRYATARSWSSLFVLEYRDAEAFGKREATVAKVRERLKDDPAWKALSDGKQKVRVEKQTIIAEELFAK